MVNNTELRVGVKVFFHFSWNPPFSLGSESECPEEPFNTGWNNEQYVREGQFYRAACLVYRQTRRKDSEIYRMFTALPSVRL